MFAILATIATPRVLAQSPVVPSGNGSYSNPYQITVLGNLVWLGKRAATENTSGKYFKLMNDIDASATASWNDSGTSTDILEGFDPINTNHSSAVSVAFLFQGVFLGQSHHISNLYINRPELISVGLFGYVDSDAIIQNLWIDDCNVTGHEFVGGLIGYNCGSVKNCHVSGFISASGIVGGLIGQCAGYSKTIQCHSEGSIKINGSSGSGVGGLVGSASCCQITQCFSTVDVEGSYADCVGGLVGYNCDCAMVEDCYATGNVSGGTNVGGLTGNNWMRSEIIGSYALGDVNGSGSHVGGLTGWNYSFSVIEDCYASGDVTSIDSYAGGLVGSNSSSDIIQSSAFGDVTVEGLASGGLVGYSSGSNMVRCYTPESEIGTGVDVGELVGNNEPGNVSQCYASVATQNLSVYVGGLIGFNTGTLSECYSVGAVYGSGSDIGGLIGCNTGTLSECYSVGAVHGFGSDIGGLIGCNTGTFSECYSVGAVHGSGSDIGGLIGLGSGMFNSSYWNTESSGCSWSSQGGGMTTAQMMRSDCFVGWDFTTIPVWGIQDGYPYLKDFATCTLTYHAGEHGAIQAGNTSGASIGQVINLYASSTPVTAIPNTGYKFDHWSDSSTVNPRIDTGQSIDTVFEAFFEALPATNTPTITPTFTPTSTFTSTPTFTPTQTPSPSPTETITPTPLPGWWEFYDIVVNNCTATPSREGLNVTSNGSASTLSIRKKKSVDFAPIIPAITVDGALAKFGLDGGIASALTVNGALASLTTKNGFVDTVEAVSFGVVKMAAGVDDSGSVTLMATGTKAATDAPVANVVLVGILLDEFNAPEQSATIKSSSRKRKVDGWVVVDEGGIDGDIVAGNLLSAIAIGGDISGSIQANGVVKTVSSKAFAVKSVNDVIVYGGTISASVSGASDSWMSANIAYWGAGKPAIGTLFGSVEVSGTIYSGYAEEESTLSPTYASGLSSIGTLKTGTISGEAHLSPLAKMPIFKGDTDALGNTFFVYTSEEDEE
jgi:hypothetical protein